MSLYKRNLIAVASLLLVSLSANADYDDLLQLFDDWRDFESPPLLNGAPDYTSAGFSKRQNGYKRCESV